MHPVSAVVAAAFLSGGCFSLWSASMTASIVFVFLVMAALRSKTLVLPCSLPALVVFGVVLAYGASVFYAVDGAMAFLGFVKMTAVAGFLVLASQNKAEHVKNDVWNLVPLLGGCSVAVCLCGVFLTFFTRESYFFQNDRLGGFFGYANTYALWLLLGLVVLAFRDKWQRRHYAFFALSVCGIFLAISRSLAVISIFALALLFLLRPAARRLIASMTPAGLALGVFAFLLRGMQGDYIRLLQTPDQAGEWLSRMVYYQDGLHLIASHPAGLGYLGYWYSQPAWQTAFYDTRFVHCSVLQYAIDIGVLPALALAVLGAVLIFSKKTPLMEKMILALVCGHSLIDIDLEYLLLIFIICLCLPLRASFAKTAPPVIPSIVAVLLVFTHCYFGIASFAADKGHPELALALYPCNTEVLESQMMRVPTLEKAVPYAHALMKRNDYAFLAMDTLARDSFGQGDIRKAASLKLDSLAINRLLASDYLELLSICAAGYEAAMVEEKPGEAEYFRHLIVSIPGMMEQAGQSLNKNAYRLKHKPDLQLPVQALEYIESHTQPLGC